MIIEELSRIIDKNNIVQIQLYYLVKPYSCVEILKDIVFDEIASSHENMILISSGIVNCVQCSIIKVKILNIQSIINGRRYYFLYKNNNIVGIIYHIV